MDFETSNAWESGQVGRDIEHAKRARPEIEEAVDAALGVEMISIRLQKDLIDDFEKLAEIRGVGYQPLMREELPQFVCAEDRRISMDFRNRNALKRSEQKASSRRDRKVA